MKVGDKYVHTRYVIASTPFEKAVVGIFSCVRTTKTLAICMRDRGNGAPELRLPINTTAAATVELEIAIRELDARLAKRVQAERVAATDPKTPYLNRLKNGDYEPWDKLTLEQLQTITKWLDAAAASTAKDGA